MWFDGGADQVASPSIRLRAYPLSSELGTFKTVKARFRPWRSVKVLKPFQVVPSSLGRRVQEAGAAAGDPVVRRRRRPGCEPLRRILDCRVCAMFARQRRGESVQFWSKMV
jgi:hypothetical protein